MAASSQIASMRRIPTVTASTYLPENKTISTNTKRRAEQQRYRGTEQFKALSNFRNGVETIPSILRRKYHVDHMPVHGLIRSRLFFGCKIGALNFRKFCKYIQGCKNHTLNTVMA